MSTNYRRKAAIDYLAQPCAPDCEVGEHVFCHLSDIVELLTRRAECDELRETLAVVGGERDSLQLRVQQLAADEDRLDWCEAHVITIDDELRQVGSGDWQVRTSDAIGRGLTLRAAIDRARET